MEIKKLMRRELNTFTEKMSSMGFKLTKGEEVIENKVYQLIYEHSSNPSKVILMYDKNSNIISIELFNGFGPQEGIELLFDGNTWDNLILDIQSLTVIQNN